MEAILSLFIFHDAYVVSFLVAAIMIITIILLTFNFKSPESVVMNEVNSSENIEGALRRVLGENSWVGAGQDSDDGASSAEAIKKIGKLESEVLSKDKEIADLHKQLTQGNTSGEGDGGDNSELMEKIDELEARLQEYEIIEDDIADLSLYKAENEKLKEQLENMSGAAPAPAQEEVPEEENLEAIENALEEAATPASAEDVVEVAPEEEPTPVATELDKEESDEEVGRDLVAEFEKVVNNKDAIVGDAEGSVSEGDGSVSVKGTPKKEAMDIAHPKLKDVAADSKEEAEIFIADLKALKKGS
jgi:flagellar motility protein MotE (MotC chaperone)